MTYPLIFNRSWVISDNYLTLMRKKVIKSSCCDVFLKSQLDQLQLQKLLKLLIFNAKDLSINDLSTTVNKAY